MLNNPLETIFPYPSQKERLEKYQINRELLEGNHWAAFAMMGDKQFSEKYAMLRYVVCNFAGLVSKVIADILFGEEIQIRAGKNQAWLEDLWFKNKMKQQGYESEMSNSAVGDAVFRLRVENNEIFIEDVNPAIYFPHLHRGNLRKDPQVEELAWTEMVGNTKYLIREMHEIGKVNTFINEITDKGEIDVPVDVAEYNRIAGTNYVAFVNTKIKRKLLVHIPNFRYSGNFWGVSDYADLGSLIFALNNRMTKIENILDKHSDPILAVPEGVLDEEGKVKKESLGMFEISDKDAPKPEYIVWNASLDNAFKEIEKLVDFLFMFSETAPDILGLGKNGAADSGRALKMRLVRTLAKKNRKQLYYDLGIKQVMIIAQELSLANGFTVNGEKCPGAMEMPSLQWADGVVNDQIEEIDNAIKKIDAGLLSRKSAIMDIESIDESEAKKRLKEIDKDKPEPPAVVVTNAENREMMPKKKMPLDKVAKNGV